VPILGVYVAMPLLLLAVIGGICDLPDQTVCGKFVSRAGFEIEALLEISQ
jgi:hypothetical protein